MCRLLGQDILLSQINSLTIDSFPRTCLLQGEKGCGKHLLIKLISEKLRLESIKLEDISVDIIADIQSKSEPFIYYIDADELTEKDQNVLLKFIEEPLKNSYIILITENIYNLLPTIVNRCVIFNFCNYARNDLFKFAEKYNMDKDDIIDICNTPGKIIEYQYINFEELFSLCDKIADKIFIAPFYNTLTIANKLNLNKDDNDKIDIRLFIDCLSLTIYKKYLENNNKKLLDLYKVAINYKNNFCKYKKLNQENLFLNFITNIWMESRKDG